MIAAFEHSGVGYISFSDSISRIGVTYPQARDILNHLLNTPFTDSRQITKYLRLEIDIKTFSICKIKYNQPRETVVSVSRDLVPVLQELLNEKTSVPPSEHFSCWMQSKWEELSNHETGRISEP